MSTENTLPSDTANQSPKRETQASRPQLELALRYLDDEFARLHSLSTALLRQVQPLDEVNPSENTDEHAWRLAQLLDERLESTEFMSTIRSLVLGKV